MKTSLLQIIFLYATTLMMATPLAPWTKASLHDHMVEINAEWNCNSNQNELLADLPILFSSDQDRIQMHLRLVEETLRARSTDHLNQGQRVNRFRHLATLRQYWQDGQFPINDRHTQRQPYFVDEQGTHCAVGYLLAEDQSTEMVTAVRNNKNYDYIAAIAQTFPMLPAWADENGFTLDELAWIQPGYAPVSRGWNAVGNGGGCNGEILTITNYNDEWLVMAGQFSEIDGHAANNIVGWNGESWFNFGQGLNGVVYDLDFFRGTSLIAVGDFSLYDDPEMKNIAIWDIEQERWIGLQSGEMDGVIYTVNHSGYFGPYYVGGTFSQMDGNSGYQNLAFFEYDSQSDTYNWSNNDGTFSVDGPVYDLQMNDYQLLVAGEFSLTGSMSNTPEQMLNAGNLAYWNEYDQWIETLDTELPAVRSAFLNNGYLYLGAAGLGQVDVLNGGLWQQVQGIHEIYEQEHSPVNGFLSFRDEVFAYGDFFYSPFLGDFGQSLAAIVDNYAYGLAVFDDEITAATAFRGELLVAGSFTSVDGEPVAGLASSDLLVNDIDDPTNPLSLNVWSHGQEVYFKATGLPDEAYLTFYNIQGQELLQRKVDQGHHLTSFSLDYQGAVICQVNTGGYQQVFKLVLFD